MLVTTRLAYVLRIRTYIYDYPSEKWSKKHTLRYLWEYSFCYRNFSSSLAFRACSSPLSWKMKYVRTSRDSRPELDIES